MAAYYTPSIFELLACDKLKNGLREALRYLLDNIRHLDGPNRIPLPPTDESILIIDLFIEYNYLKSYNASYAENLYNLIRLSRSSGNKDKAKLWPSLLCLAIIPYIRRKIDKYFDELNFKEKRSAKELKRLRIYKLATKSATFLDFMCLLRYSAGQSAYHTSLDGLLDIALRGKIPPLEGSNDLDDSESKSKAISRQIADFTGRLLTVGSYIIQFLDYWNTHSNSSRLFGSSLPIPCPPSTDGLAYTDERSSNLCLICLHVRQNECALSNTGYVFCYKCLLGHITRKQRCPVTGYPTTLDNIVRLFTSTPS